MWRLRHLPVVLLLLLSIAKVLGQAPPDTSDLQPLLGDPISGLSPEELQQFEWGKFGFEVEFKPKDGLGPAFNGSSCAQCHSHPVIGGFNNDGNNPVTHFGHRDPVTQEFDPLDDDNGPLGNFGGTLFQAKGVTLPDKRSCRETFPDGVANVVGLRPTTPVFGAGLIDSIPDEQIQNPPEVNGKKPIATGRVHMVLPLESKDKKLRVGRFGRKAQFATLLSFTANAARGEMGITNEILPEEDLPNGKPIIPGCDQRVDDPIFGEDDPTEDPFGENASFIDRLMFYQNHLAAPPRTPKSRTSGETVFSRLGCTTCHTSATFVTKSDIPQLNGRSIQPYSDFRLHNMGTPMERGARGTDIQQGKALSREFRTFPLWAGLGGVGFIGNDLTHCKRVLPVENVPGETIQECRAHRSKAIAMFVHSHLGDAAPSTTKLLVLMSKGLEEDLDNLFWFLQSMGRAEFDFTLDGRVDMEDFVAQNPNDRSAPSFRNCYLREDITPDHVCSVADADQNRIVDLADFELFARRYSGTESRDQLKALLPDNSVE